MMRVGRTRSLTVGEAVYDVGSQANCFYVGTQVRARACVCVCVCTRVRMSLSLRVHHK
jgi:hypothetical protein